jgi:hypothetical protein
LDLNEFIGDPTALFDTIKKLPNLAVLSIEGNPGQYRKHHDAASTKRPQTRAGWRA